MATQQIQRNSIQQAQPQNQMQGQRVSKNDRNIQQVSSASQHHQDGSRKRGHSVSALSKHLNLQTNYNSQIVNPNIVNYQTNANINGLNVITSNGLQYQQQPVINLQIKNTKELQQNHQQQKQQKKKLDLKFAGPSHQLSIPGTKGHSSQGGKHHKNKSEYKRSMINSTNQKKQPPQYKNLIVLSKLQKQSETPHLKTNKGNKNKQQQNSSLVCNDNLINNKENFNSNLLHKSNNFGTKKYNNDNTLNFSHIEPPKTSTSYVNGGNMQYVTNSHKQQDQSLSSLSSKKRHRTGGSVLPKRLSQIGTNDKSLLGKKEFKSNKKRQQQQYFLDKSTLLKQHLSPSTVNKDRSIDNNQKKDEYFVLSDGDIDFTKISKNKTNKIQGTNIMQQIQQINKSNMSTITAQIEKKIFSKGKNQSLIQGGINPLINNTVQLNQQNNQIIQGQQQRVINIKGIDKLIKQNLKKNKIKEEEEIVKKYHDEHKQRQKKLELSQRNQEVRKINASKIIYNHNNQQLNQQQLVAAAQKVLKYKKQRSKSCINKSDNIFSNANVKKEKGLLQGGQQINNVGVYHQQNEVIHAEEKKERKREKSFVLQMKELNKEINQEIKREIQAGIIKVPMANNINIANTTKNKQLSNQTTINAQKESNSDTNLNKQVMKQKIQIAPQYYQNKQQLFVNPFNPHKKSKSRSKSRDPNLKKLNKIQKFIEKRKKAQNMKKSLEQTLEQEKQQKIIENLTNLNIYVKQHIRHQSQNINNSMAFNGAQNLINKRQPVFSLLQNQALQANQQLDSSQQQLYNIANSGSKDKKTKKKLKPKFLKNQDSHSNKKNFKENNIEDEQTQEYIQNISRFQSNQGILDQSNNQLPSPNKGFYKIQNQDGEDNDVSLECYNEYQRLINSMQKAQIKKDGKKGKTNYQNEQSSLNMSSKQGSQKKDKNLYKQILEHNRDESSKSNSSSKKKKSQKKKKIQKNKKEKREEIYQNNQNDHQIQQDNQYQIDEQISLAQSQQFQQSLIKSLQKVEQYSQIGIFDQSSPDTQKQVTAVKQNDNSNDDQNQKMQYSKGKYNKEIQIKPFVPLNQVSNIMPSLQDTSINLQRTNLIQNQKEKKKSLESHSKSPQSLEHNRKIKLLIKNYGQTAFNYQQPNKGKEVYHKSTTSDTKLLINLHSAAITIQQFWRRKLSKQGYYENQSEFQSEMYVDSENEYLQINNQNQQNTTQKQVNIFYGQQNSIENNNQTFQNKDQVKQKQPFQYLPQGYPVNLNSDPPSQLQTKIISSPLRMKVKQQLFQDNQQSTSQQRQSQFQDDKKDSTKFYGDDQSDLEKVVVCSVISSGRPDCGEENSLNNTLKYVPLRNKQQKLSNQQLQNQQDQSTNQASYKQIKTTIKNDQQKQQIKYQEQKEQEIPQKIEVQTPVDLSSSQRMNTKKIVPQLDFGKLMTSQNIQNQAIEEEKHGQEEQNSTNRNIFNRNPFVDFMNKKTNQIDGQSQSEAMYPQMFKIREEAIQYREQIEKKYIDKMYKNKQLTPRTYVQKQKELEIWVTKEKEEVKKTQKVFQQQWTKTKQMIEQTEKNQEIMKKILLDSGRVNSIPSRRTAFNGTAEYQDTLSNNNQILLSSHRSKSNRGQDNRSNDQLHLLEKIYEKNDIVYEEDNKQQQNNKIIPDEQKVKDINEKKMEQISKDNERLRQLEIEDHKIQQELQKAKEEQIRIQKEEQEKIQKEQEKRKQEEQLNAIKLQQQEKQKQLIEEEKKQKAKQENDLLLQQQKIQEEKEKQQKIQDEKLKKQQEKQKIDDLYNQKMKAMNQKFAKKQEEDQSQLFQMQQMLLQHDKQYIPQVTNQLISEYDSEPDLNDSYHNQFENKLLSNLIGQDIKKGKTIDEDSSDNDLNQQNVLAQIEQLDDEPSRGLSRTRNSQDLLLKIGEINEELKDQQIIDEQNLINNQNIQPIKVETIQPIDQKSQNVDSNDQVWRNKDFFTKNFDDENQNEAISKLETTNNMKQFLENFNKNKDQFNDKNYEGISNEELSDNQRLIKQSKPEENNKHNIFIQNQGEEENKIEEIVIEQPSKVQQIKEENKISTQQQYNYLSSITSEYDERAALSLVAISPNGVPVSPASVEGELIRGRGAFGIQTGSQSLESTLSDEKKLKQAVSEINNQIINNISEINNQSIVEIKNDQNIIDEKTKIGEEIVEDIYKILMAEMKVELDLLLLRDQKAFQKEEERQPHQNYFLSESGRFLIFERKGIKTDLFAIERYVEEILEEVIRDKKKFLNLINEPIVKKPLDVLNQLQNSEIGSYEHFDITYPTVLPLEMYLKLEKKRKENREKEQLKLAEHGISNNNSSSPQQGADKNFLAECEHIHNKVLFDCINDSLLQFKPFGKDGAPLTWSRQSRRLKPIEDFTIEEMFEIVKHDLFRWAIMQAGTLPRKEFVFSGVFDDELFAEIREKKLATLLAREMIENEPKWLNYEFEEAQVKIDIGDMILEQLVTETISILNERMGKNK